MTDDLHDLMDINGLKVKPLFFNDNLNTGYPLGNMSMCKFIDDLFLVTIRQFNYHLLFSHRFTCCPFDIKSPVKGRTNYFIVVDKHFNFVQQLQIDIPPAMLEAIEDIRVLKMNDNLWQCSATSIDHAFPKIILFDVEYVDNKLKLASNPIIVADKIPQKNWIPIEGQRNKFIKTIDNNRIEIVDVASCTSGFVNCNGISQSRGSTQWLMNDSQYIGFVHTKSMVDMSKTYQEVSFMLQLIVADDSFSCAKMSIPFSVNHQHVQFTCGFYVDDNDTITLPVTTNDSQSFVFQFTIDQFKRDIGMMS